GNKVVRVVLGRSAGENQVLVRGSSFPFVRMLYDPQGTKRLEEVLETHKVELLHVNILNPRWVRPIVHVSESLSIPLVATVHSWVYVCPNGWAIKFPQLEQCELGVNLGCLRGLWNIAGLYDQNAFRRVIDGMNQYYSLRYMLKKSTALISPSRLLSDALKQSLGVAEVHVIPNPLPPSTLDHKPS